MAGNGIGCNIMGLKGRDTEAPKKRKRRSPAVPWKKPKDMPRRPLSAYNLFFKDEREAILKDDTVRAQNYKHRPESESSVSPKRSSKEDFASLTKQIAAKWNVLDASLKVPYEAEAAKEKARYNAEMVVWRAKKSGAVSSGRTQVEQNGKVSKSHEQEPKNLPQALSSGFVPSLPQLPPGYPNQQASAAAGEQLLEEANRVGAIFAGYNIRNDVPGSFSDTRRTSQFESFRNNDDFCETLVQCIRRPFGLDAPATRYFSSSPFRPSSDMGGATIVSEDIITRAQRCSLTGSALPIPQPPTRDQGVGLTGLAVGRSQQQVPPSSNIMFEMTGLPPARPIEPTFLRNVAENMAQNSQAVRLSNTANLNLTSNINQKYPRIVGNGYSKVSTDFVGTTQQLIREEIQRRQLQQLQTEQQESQFGILTTSMMQMPPSIYNHPNTVTATTSSMKNDHNRSVQDDLYNKSVANLAQFDWTSEEMVVELDGSTNLSEESERTSATSMTMETIDPLLGLAHTGNEMGPRT